MFGAHSSRGKQKPLVIDTSGVIVGNVKKSFFNVAMLNSKRRWLFLALIIAIGIVSITTVLLLKNNSHHKPPVPLSNNTSEISKQVESLNAAQTKTLATSNPNPKKDLNWAYAKAQAQVKTDDYRGATEEFQSLTSQPNVPYYVYKDYAVAQSLNGDLLGAIKSTQTAIEKLKSDPSVSSDAKQTEQHLLEAYLKGYQSEAGQ